MSPAELARLRVALGGCTIGREIVALDSTTSTNDAVRQLATANTREGIVVIAETQTAGRGTYGRGWESARGLGLWLSLLLRPHVAISESPRLTHWLAETIARTLHNQLQVAAEVKAPNDVLIGGRKVAGVLVEMCATANGHFAVAGIGINVNQQEFSDDLATTATSLRIECRREIDRCALAIALLQQLDASYAELFVRPPARRSSPAAIHDTPAAKFPKA